MKADCGPWPGTASSLKAAAQLEKQWIVQKGDMISSVPFCSPIHLTAPRTLALLDQFIDIAPLIVPDPQYCVPVLVHPDLSLANVFVSPTGPADVKGFIDWQDASMAPLCLQVSPASAVVYKDGEIIGFVRSSKRGGSGSYPWELPFEISVPLDFFSDFPVTKKDASLQ
ncbi:hypothetical protein Hypma_011085 [Hypsizygus marmoreus]|uniref:Altered inheritance of mitochondria protein 9, mitochondrial n=1 Tax=Hypsizygus marmoreus TaxID=39966 RepID=A0A369JRF9_HYPMA|nr:hypothetical protein Hypma_011085 [Hypsizygus marmoreus]